MRDNILASAIIASTLFTQQLALAAEVQASSMLSLKSGVSASANLASQISIEEAEKMMKDTTMYSHSVVHKKNFFVFGYECPEEAKYIILGMLAAIWIAGFVLFLTCVCCGCNSYGRYDKENGLTAYREKREKSQKAKDDEEAVGMMEGEEKM